MVRENDSVLIEVANLRPNVRVVFSLSSLCRLTCRLKGASSEYNGSSG